MASLAERFSERMREAKSLQAAADKARKDAKACKEKEEEFDDQADVFKEEEDEFADESDEQRQHHHLGRTALDFAKVYPPREECIKLFRVRIEV